MSLSSVFTKLLTAFFLGFSSTLTVAQTTDIHWRVKQAPNDENLISLFGNVHPHALPEFDRGTVPDAQSLRRMLFVLRRNPDQENGLQKLLNEQQEKSSPNYNAWV